MRKLLPKRSWTNSDWFDHWSWYRQVCIYTASSMVGFAVARTALQQWSVAIVLYACALVLLGIARRCEDHVRTCIERMRVAP